MKITRCTVSPLKSVNNGLVALAKIVLDDSLIIHNIRIIRGNNRVLVLMPSVKPTGFCTECGKRGPSNQRFCAQCGRPFKPHSCSNEMDVVHPLNNELRELITEAVLDEWRNSNACATSE